MLIDRLRAYVMIATWAIGLGLLGPPCVILTILTGIEAFTAVPTAATIWLGMRLARVKVTIVGKVDRDLPAIYAPNHQSLLDGPLMWAMLSKNVRPAGFLVKKELDYVPVLGWGGKRIGFVTIDRRNSEGAIASARVATERLRQGRPFVVFPEGTRGRGGMMLPFKKGAFRMAIDAGVPIIPISIDGAHRAMPRGALRICSHPILITVHDPIPTTGMTEADVPELMARTRAVLAAAVTEEREAARTT